MNYKDFNKDFAKRTWTNLEIIRQAQAKDGKGYEVTQILNSFLGLLVFPQEKGSSGKAALSIPNELLTELIQEREFDNYKWWA